MYDNDFLIKEKILKYEKKINEEYFPGFNCSELAKGKVESEMADIIRYKRIVPKDDEWFYLDKLSEVITRKLQEWKEEHPEDIKFRISYDGNLFDKEVSAFYGIQRYCTQKAYQTKG